MKLNCITYKYLSLTALVLAAVLLVQHPARAQQMPQQVNISSSPNPVGSGARATGMGGAFIAVADDATAASWNPAGLTQLRTPEFSFAVSYFKLRETFSAAFHPETKGTQEVSDWDINYMSLAYPFTLFRRNMIVSLNYQRLYEFDRDMEFDFMGSSGNPFTGTSTSFSQAVDYRQKGALRTISPAFAIQITPNLSFGITCNFWTTKLFGLNGWETNSTVKGTIRSSNLFPTSFTTRDHDRYSDFNGFNMHIGLLWNINRYIAIGGVVKTPFTATAHHKRLVQTTIRQSLGITTRNHLKIRESVDIDMPLSYGLGVALRLSDRLTVSCDVYRTEWSHYILEDGRGNRMSPISGKPSHQSRVKATHQVRLGAEYLFIFPRAVIPLRCGIFYDPEPSEKNPEDYWGFSLGTGIAIDKIIFDIAYQFRYGDNVEGDVTDIPHARADVTQHTLLMSVIYHF